MTKLVDIEIGHPYLTDNFDPQEYARDQLRFFEKAERRSEHAVQEGFIPKYSLLIDDLDIVLSPEKRTEILSDLALQLNKNGFAKVTMVFESALQVYADDIINVLRKDNVYSYGNRKFLGIKTVDPFLWASENIVSSRSIKDVFFRKLDGLENDPASHSQSQFLIPLKEPSADFRKYGCSLLTAVWYLRRLNVSGFGGERIEGQPIAKLENILPQKYLKSEGFALDILSLCGPRRIRDAAKKIEYLIIR